MQIIHTFTDGNKTLKAQGEENKNIEMEDGYLTVEVISAKDNKPIPRATVMVYSELDGEVEIRKVMITGINGRTETIALPAPAKKYSLTETSVVVPYSKYTIRIEFEGYYTNVYKNAQVFADTLSIQTSRMTQLPFGVKNTPGLERIYTVPETTL